MIAMHLPDHPLFDELKRLALPVGEYAVFGSGPLWVRSIRESEDIDIIARGAAWEWAKVNGKTGIKEGSGLDYASFFDGSIEVYHVWYPGEWDIDQLIDTAEMVDGVPFVGLEHVIAWKKIMGREKDAIDLALIEEYLKREKF
jgi:hypothetical protein